MSSDQDSDQVKTARSMIASGTGIPEDLVRDVINVRTSRYQIESFLEMMLAEGKGMLSCLYIPGSVQVAYHHRPGEGKENFSTMVIPGAMITGDEDGSLSILGLKGGRHRLDSRVFPDANTGIRVHDCVKYCDDGGAQAMGIVISSDNLELIVNVAPEGHIYVVNVCPVGDEPILRDHLLFNGIAKHYGLEIELLPPQDKREGQPLRPWYKITDLISGAVFTVGARKESPDVYVLLPGPRSAEWFNEVLGGYDLPMFVNGVLTREVIATDGASVEKFEMRDTGDKTEAVFFKLLCIARGQGF